MNKKKNTRFFDFLRIHLSYLITNVNFLENFEKFQIKVMLKYFIQKLDF